MAQRVSRPSAVLVTALTLMLGGCTSPDARVKQHQDKLRSLAATTTSIGEAFAARNVSPTFARLALEQTFQLLQQERAAIAPSAQDLTKPETAALLRDSDAIAQQITVLVHDIDNGDRASAGGRLTDVQRSSPDHQ